MSGYRFCRSDDIPLLVDAYNRCYRPHFRGLQELDVDRFKRLSRELDLWTSSCMVALADDGSPISVLLAAKRERENLIYRVGVSPGHERQGHGRHLLDSLSQKMAILGPPRLRAEVAEDWSGPRRFLERCGYRQEGLYRDFVLPPKATEGAASDSPFGVVPITLDEVRSSGLGETGTAEAVCWERSGAPVGMPIGGVALASEAIEAYVLIASASDDEVRVVAFGSRGAERREAMLGLLFRHLSRSPASPAAGRPIRLPRVAELEIPFAALERIGFEPGAATILYAHRATPV